MQEVKENYLKDNGLKDNFEYADDGRYDSLSTKAKDLLLQSFKRLKIKPFRPHSIKRFKPGD